MVRVDVDGRGKEENRCHFLPREEDVPVGEVGTTLGEGMLKGIPSKGEEGLRPRGGRGRGDRGRN